VHAYVVNNPTDRQVIAE